MRCWANDIEPASYVWTFPLRLSIVEYNKAQALSEIRNLGIRDQKAIYQVLNSRRSQALTGPLPDLQAWPHTFRQPYLKKEVLRRWVMSNEKLRPDDHD